MAPIISQQETLRYIRAKVDQLLTVMGTLPLRPEELDDDTLIALDPIGIVAESFRQVIGHLNETNQRLAIATGEIRAIFDTLGAAVIVLDCDDRIEDCNHRAGAWLFGGIERAQALGRVLAEVCPCDDALAELRSRADGASHNASVHGRDMQIVASKIVDAAGRHAKTVMLFSDITLQKETERHLELYSKVFSHVGEGILITDADNRIVEVNDAVSRITGYSRAELIGATPGRLKSGLHPRPFYEEMWRTLRAGGYWQGEVFDRTCDNRVIPLLESITEVRDAAGALTHHIAVMADISSLKETQTQLDFLAHHDVLTKLPNRLLFSDRLRHAIERSQRDSHPIALLFIDLDHFKTLNDTRGHDIGDLLLQQVALRLSGCVREGDTVARLGGDEFVVMLEDLHEDAQEALGQVETVGEKILAVLNQTYRLGSYTHHCTASLGVTLFADHRGTLDDLLKQADLAMYQAKAAGRNTLRFFDPQMQALVTARAALEAGLREGILKDQFFLYYQAQVDGQGRLTGAEALLRWMNPQRGMVSPAEFIPLAEETGLILPLGHWVLETACAQLVAWAARPEMAHLSIAVNVSARQFRHADFVDQVLAVLDKTGADPRRLKLELTESLLVSNVEDIIAKMGALKAKGVGFSLDDFGTGYSSLSYLKRLPLDQLKIDQGFVRDIMIDANDAAIAKTVVALADNLGLAVIAEGVEVEAQREFLALHGCHAYQGFLFSRPLPLAEFDALFKRLLVQQNE